jgi:hypothetical protein
MLIQLAQQKRSFLSMNTKAKFLHSSLDIASCWRPSRKFLTIAHGQEYLDFVMGSVGSEPQE